MRREDLLGNRHVLLAAIRFLPGWSSSLALALLFLCIWISPEWLGWESLTGFETAIFVEIAGVYVSLFMLAAYHPPLGWVSILPLAVLLGLALYLAVDVLLAIVLPIHLIIRVSGIRSDIRTEEEVFRALLVSVGLMACCWIAVGLLPLPQLGWTIPETPYHLWWEAPAWTGSKRVPYGLPAWGFLYFLLTAVIDVVRHVMQSVERTAVSSCSGSTP